jgi:hypothetical protein
MQPETQQLAGVNTWSPVSGGVCARPEVGGGVGWGRGWEGKKRGKEREKGVGGREKEGRGSGRELLSSRVRVYRPDMKVVSSEK